MSTPTRYRKPPVMEALCEISFTGSHWDDTVPGCFYDRIKADFPGKRQVEVFEAEVSLGSAGEADAGIRRLLPRIQFLSQKGDRLIQLGRDLLVVNQLRPYPHFEEWEPVIYSTLEIYRELTKPSSATRLGVRYINRIVIPEMSFAMQKYFMVYPNLPVMMGDTHGAFMVRFEIPSGKRGHTVLVTFATASAERAGEIAFLLDLYDSFQAREGLPWEDVPEEARAAHDSIQKSFEGSITDSLRELFEPEEKT